MASSTTTPSAPSTLSPESGESRPACTRPDATSVCVLWVSELTKFSDLFFFSNIHLVLAEVVT